MITKSYTRFFEDLSRNNHKEWFHANKKQYEKEVKEPFIQLLDELLVSLTEWDSRILPDPKKALFRINRDVRFAKDKSPYNTIMKAGFSPHGKKSILPGYYLGIDAHSIHVGGGLFMLRPPELKKVREYIAEEPKMLEALVQDPSFTQNFGKIKGEKSKRLDKSLIEAAGQTDLVYHKQFYAMAEFPLEPFYGKNELVQEVLSHFEAIRPLNTYLGDALD